MTEWINPVGVQSIWDAIRQLQGEVDALQPGEDVTTGECVDMEAARDVAVAHNRELLAENAELRAAVDKGVAEQHAWHAAYSEQTAENAALRAVYEAVLRLCSPECLGDGTMGLTLYIAGDDALALRRAMEEVAP